MSNPASIQPLLDEDSGRNGLYPIRAVAYMTGINPVTLRAWERRYGLVVPVRTEKGHRLYTREDIQKLQRIQHLLTQGVAIGQVRSRLEKHAAQGRPADEWGELQSHMLEAIVGFNEARLDAVLQEVMALYPLELVSERLLVPVLKSLGDRWERTQGGIAEEHFFASYLRNAIGARFHRHPPKSNSPRLLAACLPGEQHELGLLLFCLAAKGHGYQITYLGAGLPLSELVVAQQKTAAQALLLSGTTLSDKHLLEKDLPALLKACPVPVLVGGEASLRQYDRLQQSGAQILGVDISEAMHRLQKLLPT